MNLHLYFCIPLSLIFFNSSYGRIKISDNYTFFLNTTHSEVVYTIQHYPDIQAKNCLKL